MEGGKKEVVCAQLSCGDPQSTLASCLHSGDLTTFTAVLADVAPLEDGKIKGVSLSDDEKKLFPLPDDHWINQPVDGDGGLLLLQISVRQKNSTFTELLVSCHSTSRNG